MVVYFYGGAWGSGEKTGPPHLVLADGLASRGAVVAIPDYRLRDQAVFPDFMDDAARAITWARENASRFGADPQRIYLAGHSTGAWMALLAGLDPRYLGPHGFGAPQPAGLIGISGIYEQKFFEMWLAKAIFGPRPDLARLLLVNHLRPGMPPLLLLHGASDTIVEAGQSARLGVAATIAGGQAEVKLYPGIGHLDVLMSAPWVPGLAPVADDIAGFIRDHGEA